MTPQQVAEATHGEAALTKAGRTGKAKGVNSPGNKGEFNEGGETFKVEYVYDEAGLLSVMLEPKKMSKAACQRLAERTVTERGEALRMIDQVIIKLLIWHDKPAQNRIRLLLSGTGEMCALYFERLSAFEEYDIKNPGLEVKPPKITGPRVGSPVDVITR